MKVCPLQDHPECVQSQITLSNQRIADLQEARELGVSKRSVL